MPALTYSRLRLIWACAALAAAAAGGCAGAPQPAWQSPLVAAPEITIPAHAAPTDPAPATAPQPRTAYAPALAGGAPPIVRGQSPAPPATIDQAPPGNDGLLRGPMRASEAAAFQDPQVQPAQFGQPLPPPPLPPPPVEPLPAPGAQPYQVLPPPSGQAFGPVFPWWQPQSNLPPPPNEALIQSTPTPIDVIVEETRTGRFMFGVGVNSDAGVTGQITIDERNFDITRPPVSFDDFMNGTAWRGAGQGFRLEAQPGNQVQRYLVSFTEPYLFNTQVSLNTSGFYYDRGYTDWVESRFGGRLAFGYRLTPDLSLSLSARAENVDIHDPRVLGVPQLDQALGNNDIFGGRVTLTHDTRDLPFAPTEGHMIELSYEQVFGSFDFPRGEVELSQYFLLRERPDGSGRHTLALTGKLGLTGSQTPIFENYYAGGFSTLRGFSFRGASPVVNTVTVGGQLRLLASAEYFFPLTADDMIKGVLFCDAGTVEQEIEINSENFRVAPGFGFRINVPALGPAPLAFDFAFPVASAPTDDRQTFSFFFGFSRQ